MFFLNDAILTATVNDLPAKFESHDVIQCVMTTHPQEYVRELNKKVTAVDPIQTTHAVIGRTLHRILGIVAVRHVNSVNVRRRKTVNKLWRKLDTTVRPGGAAAAV